MKKPNNGIPEPVVEIKAKVPLLFWKKKELSDEEKQRQAIQKINGEYKKKKIRPFRFLWNLFKSI